MFLTDKAFVCAQLIRKLLIASLLYSQHLVDLEPDDVVIREKKTSAVYVVHGRR